MAKFAKWIGGGLGWAFLGPLGGALGFVVGSVFDQDFIVPKVKNRNTTVGDYVMSVLVLTAAVLKANGRVMKSELDYVKQYYLKKFGKESATEAIKMLRDILKKDIPLKTVCEQISYRLNYPSRLELLHFLYGICVADGVAHQKEVEITGYIGREMGILPNDLESIKSMFIKQNDNAYKILKVNKNATNDEIKRAYKRLALLYHPDKVAYLGEDFKKDAEKKFKMLNEAFDQIKKERGFK